MLVNTSVTPDGMSGSNVSACATSPPPSVASGKYFWWVTLFSVLQISRWVFCVLLSGLSSQARAIVSLITFLYILLCLWELSGACLHGRLHEYLRHGLA